MARPEKIFPFLFFLCSNARMSEEGDSPPPSRRLIDAAVKARFLGALRAGARREAAAAACGFPLSSFYTARGRDPLFHLAWHWARDLAAIDERGGELALRTAEGETVRIAPGNRRLLQRRRMSWVRFTESRQQIYLDHFAGTADAEAAAAAAGVSSATVEAHGRKHPEFAALCDETLRFAYAKLEAEAVRQRLEAQARLRENLVPTGEMAQEFARGDVAAEFERVMKLLARYDRRDGRVARREVGRGHQRRWTFEEAIAALDKRLRALGLRHGIADDGEPDDGEPDRAE